MKSGDEKCSAAAWLMKSGDEKCFSCRVVKEKRR
jgi:hypothetical protein